MRRGGPWLLGLAMLALTLWFSAANGRQRVRVDLGIVTLESVSLPFVVLASVALGMLTVLLVGLRADLRTRRMMRRYREALKGEE